MVDDEPLTAVWSGATIARVGQRLTRLSQTVLDRLLPPRCLACGGMVEAQGRLCAKCWAQTAFVLGRQCRGCGVPLPKASANAPICSHCLDEPPVFERARAALRYEGAGRRLVLRFKHGDRLDGATTFGKWMVRAGAELIDTAELIVPVPVHRWRLVQRSYNQSAVLARTIAARTQKPAMVDALIKRRATAAQQTLGAAERRLNVKADDFMLNRAALPLVLDRRVLLIDDVLTTGSTANACARCLLASGAAAVDVLALARVVHDADMPICL